MEIRGQITGEPPSKRDFWKVGRDANHNPVFYMVDNRSLWTVNAEKTVRKQIKKQISGEITLLITAIFKNFKKPGEVIDAIVGILKNSCLEKDTIVKHVDYKVAYVDDNKIPEIYFIIKQ
jgi:hypothetical protein